MHTTNPKWIELKKIDSQFNLKEFCKVASEIIKEEGITNIQDFEIKLRGWHFNTCLCARLPGKMSSNVKLCHFGTTNECKYECIFSCRPLQYALNEVCETNGSYEKNFEMLKEAGCLVIFNIDVFKNNDIPNKTTGANGDKVEFI